MAEFKGFRFPFQASPREVPASAVPPQLLTDSIKQILLTEKGERVMRPDFGTRLRGMLFDNIDPNFVELVRREVVDAITRWEPRVQVKRVEVVQDREFESKVTVNVEFVALGQVVATGPVLIGPP